MEHLMVELVQNRMSELREEADHDRLVHLSLAVRKAQRDGRDGRTRHNRPGLVRRVLAVR